MSSLFLSHTHSDKPFAHRLAEALKQHGIRVWVDEYEIKVGESLIQKISEGIQECEFLGVALSPESVRSEWVQRELNIALTQEIKGKRVKVLPLLYRDCALPLFLIDKFYADFTFNFDAGLVSLLRTLGKDVAPILESTPSVEPYLKEFSEKEWASVKRGGADWFRLIIPLSSHGKNAPTVKLWQRAESGSGWHPMGDGIARPMENDDVHVVWHFPFAGRIKIM